MILWTNTWCRSKENGENCTSKQTCHSHKSTLVYDLKTLHLPVTTVKDHQQRIRRHISGQNWNAEDWNFFLVKKSRFPFHHHEALMEDQIANNMIPWSFLGSVTNTTGRRWQCDDVGNVSLNVTLKMLIHAEYHLNSTAYLNNVAEQLHPFHSWLQFIHTQMDTSSRIVSHITQFMLLLNGFRKMRANFVIASVAYTVPKPQ